jgi:hypothetical protein
VDPALRMGLDWKRCLGESSQLEPEIVISRVAAIR